MLQKNKLKRSKNDVITKDSNTKKIQNKKNSVRNSTISLKNENKVLVSNKITSKFKNKSKDNIAFTKTKSKNKKKPLKCNSHVINGGKKPEAVEVQPHNINKNKPLQKKQSNNIVKKKKMNTKPFINGKNNNIEKKQELNVPLKIAAGTESTDLIRKNKSPKKHKANGTIVNEHNDTSLNIKIKDLDFDKADELIVNAKKMKLNQVYQQEDKEDELFPQENKNRVYLKKQKIKQILDKNDVNRNSIKVNGNDLRTRMLERLKGNHLKSISNVPITGKKFLQHESHLLALKN